MFDDVRVRWNPKLHKTKLLSIPPSSPSTGASLFGLILKIKKHENNLTKMIRKHTKKISIRSSTRSNSHHRQSLGKLTALFIPRTVKPRLQPI